MFSKTTRLLFLSLVIFFLTQIATAKEITISNAKIAMVLSVGKQVSITSLKINGQVVISATDGIYTSIKTGGIDYSSLQLNATPVLSNTAGIFKVSNISYGDGNHQIHETWLFKVTGSSIKWTIVRTLDKPLMADELASPQFNFDSINTWDGAYQGYGGLAWFYLFNEKLNTYGVHTRSSDFWNSKNNTGLTITADAPGEAVAMKYVRTNDDKLAYTITTSGKDLMFKSDTGTNRRRFLRGRADVWSQFIIPAGTSTQTITFSYFDFNEKYGRGTFKGLDGANVSAVLNTIARIGVIDSLHFGGNSWHTPYGPICLHEQYIAQLGLGINDPKYLKGYQSCLDYYCSHAIKPDGRVYPRWAYTNEDAMPGQFNKYGFYEAQWGILMDSNPDLVTNISELYDMNGDKTWVKSHQLTCEKVLDWILKRDENKNGLVEMMTDNERRQRSSDWIDIIWASYENAFVNAKLYHALVEWSAIERQLHNKAKATYYAGFAAKLKASFNKDTAHGGFWDEEKGCYVYWIDKDKSIHGLNMVTPVNFMAIAYGICDDKARQKIILDNIESQMTSEKLFFWPLCMTSYAAGEGKSWQFPFPGYENGDIFLSWGSIAVKAYASYDPAIAVKYVKNVLNQYSKDGLAFQRYGRTKQDGLGDDILSGNSLSIVGLYQAIYGINPLYNRFYLDPHITPELAGTELKYNFRGKKLTISLDSGKYSVADGKYKITAGKNFGFNNSGTQLSYFNSNSDDACLKATSLGGVSLIIKSWTDRKIEWEQSANKQVGYIVSQLKPNATYQLAINNNQKEHVKTDAAGNLHLSNKGGKMSTTFSLAMN